MVLLETLPMIKKKVMVLLKSLPLIQLIILF